MNEAVIDYLTFSSKMGEISNFYRYVCKGLFFSRAEGKIAEEEIANISESLSPYSCRLQPNKSGGG